jgi:hypothetical protein
MVGYLGWVWYPVVIIYLDPLLIILAVVVVFVDPVSWYLAGILAAGFLIFGLGQLIPLVEVQEPRPSEAEIAAASTQPNGLVYRITGPFGPRDSVPPQAIVGAWRVNARGEITGEFERNRRYDPGLWSTGQISS